MAKPKRGMGRGLEAILSVSSDKGAAAEEQLLELEVDRIEPNPTQPRQRFDQEALQALAGSLEERGVLQPVLVRPKSAGRFELVAGERRWRAAQIAGLKTIPALVRPRDDAAVLELALIENMAREDLSPVEEARACAALVEELGLTREEVGRRVGRGRVAVTNLIRLLDLPDDVVELLQEGTLSEGHGRALLLAEDHKARTRLARAAVQDGWSVRVVEARAREANAAEGQAGRARKGGRPKARPELHPDQVQAASEIADALGGVLGAEVEVRPTEAGGYRAQLSFESAEEALELAGRLRPRAAA